MKNLKTIIPLSVVILQVLLVLVPDRYSWENVAALGILAAVWGFYEWLQFCTKKKEDTANKRMEVLEQEVRAINSQLEWNKK